MATVSLCPSPRAPHSMASRRVPLSTISNNGANSPLRGLAAPNKRVRAQSAAADEPDLELKAAKRQMLENDPHHASQTPRETAPSTTAVQRRAIDPPRLETFQKERQSAVRTARTEKVEADEKSFESIKAWQHYYRRVFPKFVFYFDSVPDDLRRSFTRSLLALGSREDKFFSRDITHVITTKTFQKGELEQSAVPEVKAQASTAHVQSSRTINPLLLDKASGNGVGSSRSRVAGDPPALRHNTPAATAAGRNDIIQRAVEMQKKIWHVEKLSRVLANLNEYPESPHSHSARNQGTQATQTRKAALAATELSQMMKNEQSRAAVDREPVLAAADLIHFKGPYIYVRDINERTRPIMLREYSKVDRRDDGDWPQFRSTSQGKCPFVEEESSCERRRQRLRAQSQHPDQRREEIARNLQSPTRARPFAGSRTAMNPPAPVSRKRVLGDVPHGANAKMPPNSHLPAAFEKESAVVPAQSWLEHPQQAQLLRGQNFFGGEPMASGMQASNITSAIRSQMISSTAAAPGAKAGTSREIHGLQRKLFERNVSPAVSMSTMSHSQPDMSAPATVEEAAPRTMQRVAKQRAQERLGVGLGNITEHDEDATQSGSGQTRRPSAMPATSAAARSRAVRPTSRNPRDLKPGYCENCREKFEDFEEHTHSRRHRRFALDPENWRDLDRLLASLERPRADLA